MTVNITDALTFTSPVVAPTDGDPASGSTFQAGLQALANRTAFINNALTANGITAAAGVQMIRYVANAAALTAITTPVNNSSCYIQGYGLYQYNSTSASTVDSVFVINGNGGIGRWIHELYTVANTSPGVAIIGAGGASANRIPASVVPNGLVGVQYASTTILPTIGTSSTELTNLTLTFAAVAGDKLHVSFMVGLNFPSIAGTSSCALAASITDGGSLVIPLGSGGSPHWEVIVPNIPNANVNTTGVGHYVYTATASGSITVRVTAYQYTGSTNGGSNAICTHQILQFRP